MRYTYAYKTSDGQRHEATMVAESREAVFAALRAKGIKAIKVVAVDGSKANGEIRGVRKRVVAVVGVSAAVLAGLAVFLALDSKINEQSPYASSRHQIYGDPAIMETLSRNHYRNVMPTEGDAVLAHFAQPGTVPSLDITHDAAVAALGNLVENGYKPDIDLTTADGGSREANELKQIVNGMRQEMREYLANGNGTVKSYLRRLNQRTMQEIQIYERTKRELEQEKSQAVWEKKNQALRRLGLKTITSLRDEE